jgi:hypothetical protein
MHSAAITQKNLCMLEEAHRHMLLIASEVTHGRNLALHCYRVACAFSSTTLLSFVLRLYVYLFTILQKPDKSIDLSNVFLALWLAALELLPLAIAHAAACIRQRAPRCRTTLGNSTRATGKGQAHLNTREGISGEMKKLRTLFSPRGKFHSTI